MPNCNQPPVSSSGKKASGEMTSARFTASVKAVANLGRQATHDSHDAICLWANTCCTIKCTSKLSIFVPASLELFLLRLLNAIVLIRTDKTQGACKPTAPEAAWPKTFSELPHIAGRDGGLGGFGLLQATCSFRPPL